MPGVWPVDINVVVLSDILINSMSYERHDANLCRFIILRFIENDAFDRKAYIRILQMTYESFYISYISDSDNEL